MYGYQGLYDDQLSSDSSNPRTQNSIGPLEIIRFEEFNLCY